MDKCGTRVTTSWMWIRGCHTAGYCLEVLYIRDLPLYDQKALEYIVECCLFGVSLMAYLVWFDPP